jgi:multimeric flavodoxin WrbA
MKILAFNGSPRKEWNTAILTKEALRGAESKGASTELVHLYDLTYKGCTSCFACKLKGGKSYGRCALKDDLTPLFKKVEEANAIILASPVYLGAMTGEMRSFLERLVFPYYTYKDPIESLFPKRIRVGFIYTFGATEEMAQQRGWDKYLDMTGAFVKVVLGDVQTVRAFDTYQFEDYSKYESSRFDPVHKANRRKNVFPLDKEKAFALGAWLAGDREVA